MTPLEISAGIRKLHGVVISAIAELDTIEAHCERGLRLRRELQKAEEALRLAASHLAPDAGSGLTLKEAAALAKCSPDTLRKLAAAREVPSTKIGHGWLFPTESLMEWLNARCTSNCSPSAGLRKGGGRRPKRPEKARREK